MRLLCGRNTHSALHPSPIAFVAYERQTSTASPWGGRPVYVYKRDPCKIGNYFGITCPQMNTDESPSVNLPPPTLPPLIQIGCPFLDLCKRTRDPSICTLNICIFLPDKRPDKIDKGMARRPMVENRDSVITAPRCPNMGQYETVRYGGGGACCTVFTHGVKKNYETIFSLLMETSTWLP